MIEQPKGNLCKNCQGKSLVYDALGNKFFCPRCM